ncbi:hypothetical protein [Orenia marismortui]|uniref:hypothetical protein n=1 Tax=Orenia marismortui TaxID=46469 RepID=UPI000380D964|nr:hypothetical protein [Orenia marismortui]
MSISVDIHDSPIVRSMGNNNALTGANDLDKQIEELKLKKEMLEYKIEALTKQDVSKSDKKKEISRLQQKLLKIEIKLRKLELQKKKRKNIEEKKEEVKVEKNKLEKNDIVEIKNKFSAKESTNLDSDEVKKQEMIEKVKKINKDNLKKNIKLIEEIEELSQEGINIKI